MHLYFHLESILVSGKLFEQMYRCMVFLFLHSRIHSIATIPYTNYTNAALYICKVIVVHKVLFAFVT